MPNRHEDQVAQCDHSGCIRQSVDACATCKGEVCREHRRYCETCSVALCGAHARSVDECHYCAVHHGPAMAQAFEAAEAAQAVAAAMVAGAVDSYFALAVDLVRAADAGRRAEL